MTTTCSESAVLIRMAKALQWLLLDVDVHCCCSLPYLAGSSADLAGRAACQRLSPTTPTCHGEHLVQTSPMWLGFGGSCRAMCWPAARQATMSAYVNASIKGLGADVSREWRCCRPFTSTAVDGDGD